MTGGKLPPRPLPPFSLLPLLLLPEHRSKTPQTRHNPLPPLPPLPPLRSSPRPTLLHRLPVGLRSIHHQGQHRLRHNDPINARPMTGLELPPRIPPSFAFLHGNKPSPETLPPLGFRRLQCLL